MKVKTKNQKCVFCLEVLPNQKDNYHEDCYTQFKHDNPNYEVVKGIIQEIKPYEYKKILQYTKMSYNPYGSISEERILWLLTVNNEITFYFMYEQVLAVEYNNKCYISNNYYSVSTYQILYKIADYTKAEIIEAPLHVFEIHINKHWSLIESLESVPKHYFIYKPYNPSYYVATSKELHLMSNYYYSNLYNNNRFKFCQKFFEESYNYKPNEFIYLYFNTKHVRIIRYSKENKKVDKTFTSSKELRLYLQKRFHMI